MVENNMEELSCFKAYDIRGQLGSQIDEDIAYRIGRATAQYLKAASIVVGGDARETSESLKLALSRGIQDAGCNVIDLGLVGTEEIYYATSDLKTDGGIVVTASHNPIDYNGMKLVRQNSKPISGDTGLNEIKRVAEHNKFEKVTTKGSYRRESNLGSYIEHLLTYISPSLIKPLKLVVNAGNGAAGHVIDALEAQFDRLSIPIQIVKIHHQPDPTFPNGIPNPLLPENRQDTADAVIKHKADMGIAWDGDFDRCFLFDEKGQFIEGYYIVGLLAEAFLKKNRAERIIYDPRVYWNTEDIILKNEGVPVKCKTGHAFIKERMRAEDAIYGGEMSAHHYFRDFFYCDSGMIPWLLIAELMSVKSVGLSSLVADRISKFPSSGEINLTVTDPDYIIEALKRKFSHITNAEIDLTDGLGVSLEKWRFNIRKSNTEPVLRINVESKENAEMVNEKLSYLLKSIKTYTKLGESLIGFIDSIDGRNITGWAASNKTDRKLDIAIVCDGQIVARGLANLYREDLKQQGIHKGEHSFNLYLSEGTIAIDSELQLVELSTQKLIAKAPIFKISAQKEFIVEGEVKYSQSFSPDLLASPQPEVQEAQKQNGATGAKDKIATPWKYLKDSANTSGFMSLNVHSNYRFESLKYHLDAIARNSHYYTAEQVSTVHMLVVEGYENRNKFPSFSLPKFDQPKVSIIVPAYNQFNLTYHCIASIALAFNHTSYEVILADDCSTDITAEAEEIIGNIVVSRNAENLRFLRSCNQAAKKASGQYIIMLNNDTEVTSYWIDRLISQMEGNLQIGMTGSKLLNLDGTLQEAGGIVWNNGQPWNVGRDQDPLAPEYNYVRDVDYLTGAAMCIKTAVWEQVGGFSEELVPCYYEDTDIAFKVRELGLRTVYVPESEVIHFEGQSHGTDVTKGLKRYQQVNEATFRAKWIKQYRNNGVASWDNMLLEKDRNIEKRVLVIDYATPMPNQDAGSYAAIQEIKLIQSLGFKVTFVPENLAHFGKYTKKLQSLGVEVLYAPFYQSMDEVLSRRLAEMDAVYITRYHVAEKYIDKIKQTSNVKILFNNADLHFLRELRAATSTSSKDLEKALRTRDAELEVCRKADAVLCYNTTEHAVITSHTLDDSKLHLTPWVLEEKPVGQSFTKRDGIVFLGGFNHTPNGEAVEYLVNDIMPLLAKHRPDIVLHVYGSNMPASYKEMETANIKMHGFAPSLDGVYHNHRLFVAPLLSGAGIKGKVLESMAYQLPTVLTEVAAEGTGLTHGISTFIALEPQEWVDRIIQLYDDQSLWNKFAENSQILCNTSYSFEHGHKQFKRIFAGVGIYSSK